MKGLPLFRTAGLDIADEVRRLAANYLPRLTGRNAQADSEKAVDGFDELGHGDRLRQIGLATSFPDALLVAPHRKGCHRDYRNSLELGVLLEPLGHFETGDFRQLNVHQDQVRTVLAGEIECLDAVARADGMVAVSLQQIVEELHVELVVLHDHHGLRHCRPSVKRRAISATAGLAVISLGSVRASNIKKSCGLLGPDAMPRRTGAKGLVARPAAPSDRECA